MTRYQESLIINSNNYFFAGFLVGQTNAISILQTMAGFTNVNYAALVGRTYTNTFNIASNTAAISNNTVAIAAVNHSFTNFLATNAPPFGEARLTNATIASATNSTAGYGVGFLTWDTNYLYLSIASNTWRRISIPTNAW